MNRKYPDELTHAKRKMIRKVELDPFYEPTQPKTRKRFDTLVQRGYLVPKAGGGYEPAPDMLPVVTFFVQEENDGPVKIDVTHSNVIIQKLQMGHPKTLKLLGAFRGDRKKEILNGLQRHHVGHGWYAPHSDVLAWTKHKDFERA